MTGLNIQAPWARMILSEEKTVETRQYPLPRNYENKPLAVVETNNGPAMIIGLVQFSSSFKYNSILHWIEDFPRHLVEETNNTYGWKEGKHGWVVNKVIPFNLPILAPTNKGIRYTKDIFEKIGLDDSYIMDLIKQ